MGWTTSILAISVTAGLGLLVWISEAILDRLDALKTNH
jgi:hypothetical protein